MSESESEEGTSSGLDLGRGKKAGKSLKPDFLLKNTP